MMDHISTDTQTHRLCTMRSHICGNIRSPTRAFAEYPAGCCCEESFNVFTPPVKNRVKPGMLIARGTIVGFHDGMRFSAATSYRTSGITSFYFNPRVYAQHEPIFPCFYESFPAHFRFNCDRSNDVETSKFKSGLFY